MGPQFFETRMGATYYQNTIPRIANSLERIAKVLEEINEREERKEKKEKIDDKPIDDKPINGSCPWCGSKLISRLGGNGVWCPNDECGYWFS